MINPMFLSLLCSTNCGEIAVVPDRYDDCGEDVFRQYGSNHFVLQTCDDEWTDILDADEWGTKVTANTLNISPSGVLTINDPTVETFQVEGCGRTASGPLTYLVDFFSYQTEEALADYTYWKGIFKNARSWRIMFVDCNEIWYLEEDWAALLGGTPPITVAGKHPGFEFSLSQPPRWQAGENRYGRWSVQFSITTNSIMGMGLIPGAYAAL